MSTVFSALALGFVANGCGSNSTVPPVDAGPADTPAPLCAVRFEPVDELRTQIRARSSIRAQVSPARAGDRVRFALVGDALDATLSATERTVDADGSAEVELLASSSPRSFQIRASAACGGEGFRPVVVTDRGFGDLAATALYRGTRAPTRLQVALQRAADCDPATGFDQERVTDLPVPGGTVRFADVAAEVDYVVRGWAYGAGTTVLAAGCAGPFRLRAASATEIDLLFADAALTFGERYTLGLGFDLSPLTNASSTRWNADLTLELQRRGGELSALEEGLVEAIEGAALPADRPRVRQEFQTVWRESLATMVQERLAARGAGLTDTFRSLSASTASVLATVRTTGQLRRVSERWSVSDLSSHLDPGTPDLARDDVAVSMIDPGTARLEYTRADGIVATLDGLPFPYARLATSALSALTGRLGVSSAAEYVALAVCPVVVPVVRSRAGGCDDRCLTTGCRRAIVPLGASFEASIAGTDEDRATLGLRFEGGGRPVGGALTLDRVSGIAAGAFIEEPATTVQAVATLTLATAAP